MTIKQRILMRKVASAEGVTVADFGPIDKRTLSSILYQEWAFIYKERLKLTADGAIALSNANHVGIYLKNETPFVRRDSKNRNLRIVRMGA